MPQLESFGTTESNIVENDFCKKVAFYEESEVLLELDTEERKANWRHYSLDRESIRRVIKYTALVPMQRVNLTNTKSSTILKVKNYSLMYFNGTMPPRKRFVAVRKRKRTRRRVRNVKEWKRVKAKAARLSGDAYKTAKAKETQKKQLKAYEHTCRYNCNKISEQQRQTIIKKFYQLGNYDLQSNFIASCIKKIIHVE
nr:unnamed protein product [Callosobruchus chinensis]